MIYFPESPTLGQKYVSIGGITYTWLGDRWNGVAALAAGTAKFYIDGGDAEFEYDEDRDELLDGGTA